MTPRCLKPICVVTASVALLWPASTVDARRAGPAAAPRGNSQGLALLERVRSAYRHVPAILVTTRLGADRLLFVFALHEGVTSEEEFLGIGPSGTTLMDARGNGPTYAREPGTSCWRRLAASDSLQDAGLPFPDFPGASRVLVEAPRRSGDSWLLTIVTEGAHLGDSGTTTLRVNARTMQLDTMTVESEARTGTHRTATEHVEALSRRPTMPTPEPRCR